MVKMTQVSIIESDCVSTGINQSIALRPTKGAEYCHHIASPQDYNVSVWNTGAEIEETFVIASSFARVFSILWMLVPLDEFHQRVEITVDVFLL